MQSSYTGHHSPSSHHDASPPSASMVASPSASPAMLPGTEITSHKQQRSTISRKRPPLFSLWQLSALIEADARLLPVKTFVINNLSLWHYEHQLPRRPLQSGRRQALFVRRLPTMYLTDEDSAENSSVKKKPTNLRDEVLAALDVSVAGYKELLYFHDKIHTNTIIFVEAINRQFPTKKGPLWRFGLRVPLSQDGKELTSYVAQRQHGLMRNANVLAKIEVLWNLFPKDHRGFLAKSTHARIFYDFFKILAFDVVDESLRMELVRKDWELRADGRLSIDGSRFCVSMRCTVDVWCETNDPQEAVDFLGFVISVARRTLLTGDDELQRGHGLLSGGDGGGGGGGDASGHHGGGGAGGGGMEASELQGVSTVALRDGRKQVEDLMVRTLGRRNVGLHSAEDVLRRRQQLEETRNNNSPLKRLRMSGRNDAASLDGSSSTSTVASSRRKPTHHATNAFATSSLVSFVVALTTPGAVPKFDVKSSLAKRMEATETIVATRGDSNGMMNAAEASMSPSMMAPPTPSVLSKSRADLSMSKSGRSGLDASGRPGKDDSFSSRGTYASLKCLVPRKVKTTLKPNMESEFLDRYSALDLRLPASLAGGGSGPPPLPTRSFHQQHQATATLGRGVVASTHHSGDKSESNHNATEDDKEGFNENESRLDPLPSVNGQHPGTTSSSNGPGHHHKTREASLWTQPDVMFLDSFGADVRVGGSDEESNDDGRGQENHRGVRGLGMDLYGSLPSGTPPPMRMMSGGEDDASNNNDDDASFERGGCGNDSLLLLDSIPASPSGTPRNASMSSFRGGAIIGARRSGAASPRGASFVRRALRRVNESGSPPRASTDVNGDDSDDSIDEALALVERHFSRKQSMFRDTRRKSRQASEALRAALVRPVGATTTQHLATTASIHPPGPLLDDPSSSPSSTAPLASPGTMASSRASSPPGGIAGNSYTAPIAVGRLARTAAVSFRVRPADDEAPRMFLPNSSTNHSTNNNTTFSTTEQTTTFEELSLIGSPTTGNGLSNNNNMPLMYPSQQQQQKPWPQTTVKAGNGSLRLQAGGDSNDDPADQMLSSLTFSASARPQELGNVVMVDSTVVVGGGGAMGNRRRSIAAGGGRQGSSSTLRRRNTLLSFVTTEFDDEDVFEKNMVNFVHELTDNMTLEEQEAHRLASTYEDADAAHYAPLAELAIPATLIKGLARWRGPMHCTGQNDLYRWFDPRLYGVVSSVSVASLRRFSSPFVFAFLLDPWAQRFGEEQQPRLSSPTTAVAPRLDDAPRTNTSASQLAQEAATPTPQIQLRWYYERLPSMDPSDEVLSGDDDDENRLGGSQQRSQQHNPSSSVFLAASMDVGDWVMFGDEHCASLTQLWIDGLGHSTPLMPPPSHFMNDANDEDGDGENVERGRSSRKPKASFPEPAYGFDYSPIRDGKRCRMVLSVDFTTWRCGYDAVPMEDEEMGGGVVAASPLPLNRRRSSFALSLSSERVPRKGEEEADSQHNGRRRGRSGKKRHLIKGHRICAHWAYVWEYQNPTATAWCPFPMPAQVRLTNWLQNAKAIDSSIISNHNNDAAKGGRTVPSDSEWTAVSVAEKLLGLHKYREHCLSLLEDYPMKIASKDDEPAATGDDATSTATSISSGRKRYFSMTSWNGSRHISIPVRYQVLYFSKEFSIAPLRLEEEWRPSSVMMMGAAKMGDSSAAPQSTAANIVWPPGKEGHHQRSSSPSAPTAVTSSPSQRLQESFMAAAMVAARTTSPTSRSSTSPTMAQNRTRPSTQSPTARRHHQSNQFDEDDDNMLHSNTSQPPANSFLSSRRGAGGRSPQTSPVTLENISFVEESVRHALLRGGESEDGGDSRSRPGSASTHSVQFFPAYNRSAVGNNIPPSYHIVLPAATATAESAGVLSPPSKQRHLLLDHNNNGGAGGGATKHSSTLLHSSHLPMQSRRFPLRCPEAALQAEPPCIRSTYASDMFQKAQKLLGSKVEESDSTIRVLDPPRSMTVPLLGPLLPQQQDPLSVPRGGSAISSRGVLEGSPQPMRQQNTSTAWLGSAYCASGDATLGKKAFRGAMPVRKGLNSAVERRRSLTPSLSSSSSTAAATNGRVAHSASTQLAQQRNVSAYCARLQQQVAEQHRSTTTSTPMSAAVSLSLSALEDQVSVGDYAKHRVAGENKRLLLGAHQSSSHSTNKR